MNHWNSFKKPSSTICPQIYCFHWRAAGGWVAEGLYPNLQVAYQAQEFVATSRCGCHFGHCARLGVLGDCDWYEPDELQLAQDGLPWFYFIPNPQMLPEEMRDEYIRASELLWGTLHWHGCA
ncbi:hypothetical protein F8S13_12165 [Chloroflexia bacterium SDU3-3]|nr:hypothetical protein F8S13_12165 [Chloroflexia bacterium SDU3-3]